MTYETDGWASILGPCRCQGCGEPLWYAKRNTRRMGITVPKLAWREEDGMLHRCPEWQSALARARAKWDNDAAEYSGPIAHNVQRPSVRLYSEREGVGVLGVQTR